MINLIEKTISWIFRTFLCKIISWKSLNWYIYIVIIGVKLSIIREYRLAWELFQEKYLVLFWSISRSFYFHKWHKLSKRYSGLICMKKHVINVKWKIMRRPGIEPESQEWESCMIPLHHRRPIIYIKIILIYISKNYQ